MDYGTSPELGMGSDWTCRVKTDTMSAVPNYEVSDLTRLIASMIRGLMARHGVKQADMAAAIGVSQSQLSKMVRGVRPIDLDQADGMCRALGADLWEVIKEAEDVLANYDAKPNARLIFVDDNIRLKTPFDTTTWGDGGPVIPEHRASRIGAAPSSQEASDESTDGSETSKP